MGNRALRKQAAASIKAAGIPSKLYRNFFVARRRLRASELKEIIYKLDMFRPGTIVCDCDGSNHVIKGWAYQEESSLPRGFFQNMFNHWFLKANIKGYTFDTPQYLFEDGRYSCGCPSGCDPAISREEIEAYCLNVTDEYVEEQRRLGWWTEFSDRKRAHLKAGGHTHDERGILLPEWKMKYDE